MKKMFTLWVAVFLLGIGISACGGGGSGSGSDATVTPDVSEPDEEVSENTLPAIIDSYYDQAFKYEDRSLHLGTYSVLAEDCSEMFGVDVDSEVVISSIDASQISVLFFGVDEQFPAASDSEVGQFDVWGYMKEYEGSTCAVSVGSVNLGARTTDMLAFVCANDDSGDSCMSLYQRDAAYDFSNVSIKAVNDNHGPEESIIDAALNILEVK